MVKSGTANATPTDRDRDADPDRDRDPERDRERDRESERDREGRYGRNLVPACGCHSGRNR